MGIARSGGSPNKTAHLGGPVGCCQWRRNGVKGPAHANARRFGRRAQFQLWIFSYHIAGWRSKKWLSRVKIGPGGIRLDVRVYSWIISRAPKLAEPSASKGGIMSRSFRHISATAV